MSTENKSNDAAAAKAPGYREGWMSNFEANTKDGTADEFVDLMVGYYEQNLQFSGFLAGFEFIGLSDLEVYNDITEIGAFVITVSFALAMLSGIGALIELAWIRFHKGYSKEVVRKSIEENFYFLDVTTLGMTLSLVLFALSVNILVWDKFESSIAYPLTINLIFAIGGSILAWGSIKCNATTHKPIYKPQDNTVEQDIDEPHHVD